ncbi:helix-turn-helix domain-containing protein, partial [Klebsiella pneumoniae]
DQRSGCHHGISDGEDWKNHGLEFCRMHPSRSAAMEQRRVGGRRRVMTEEVVERCRRMLENGATRQQVADVTGVDVKTIYKYLPAT